MWYIGVHIKVYASAPWPSYAIGVEYVYDNHLDAFVKTVELGSFAKAAEALLIATSAVIKKVNALERDLGVSLLYRTNRGVAPTPAGEIVYHGALKVIADSNAIVQKAREVAGVNAGKVVRLASSIMRPSGRISAWWSKVAERHPDVLLEIVPITDETSVPPFERLGKDFDVVMSIEPLSDQKNISRCMVRRVFASPACVAVPVNSRFATMDSVSLSDLAGCRLYLTERGRTRTVEMVRDSLDVVNYGIDIVDCSPYYIKALNTAAREGSLVFHCMELGPINPSYVNVPLEGVPPMPFCLICLSDGAPVVKEFVEAVAAQAQRELGDVLN